MTVQDENDLWLPRIEAALCTGCGECIARCPTGALGSVAGKAALIRPSACTYCAACESVCPTNAIELPYLICKPRDEGENDRE
ncbi:MAG: 4Fe-4S binding protein [Anaerolineae bacterium]|nr:4Fe-4S binding protein [Anaerolineae bacterium]